MLVDTTKLLKEWAGGSPKASPGPMNPAVINPPKRSSSPAPLGGPVAPMPNIDKVIQRRSGSAPLGGPVAPEPLAERVKRSSSPGPLRGPKAPMPSIPLSPGLAAPQRRPNIPSGLLPGVGPITPQMRELLARKTAQFKGVPGNTFFKTKLLREKKLK